VEELYASDKSRVCLLDPAAASDLSPEDGDKFDAFLFGGILGAFLRELFSGWHG
jgi:ribosome biogenesis SPOUT family RNA methylase Rps3